MQLLKVRFAHSLCVVVIVLCVFISIIARNRLYFHENDHEITLESKQNQVARKLGEIFDKSQYNDIIITEDNILLSHALKVIKAPQDIAFFNGVRVKKIFDASKTKPHLSLHGKIKNIRSWKDLKPYFQHVANATRHSYSTPSSLPSNTTSTYGIHIHNEHKIGDLLLFILKDYAKLMKLPNAFSKHATPIRPLNITAFHRAMNIDQPPMIITNTVDENWGFLSTQIMNRTTKWINMTNHLLIHFAEYEAVHAFLNSSKVALVIGNTHVDPKIGYHEKLINLPLGVKSRQSLHDHARYFFHLRNFTKTKLLTINNSGWANRKAINEMVSKAFNFTVTNSYTTKKRQSLMPFPDANLTLSPPVAMKGLERHYWEIAQSKFVLCPSGLGMDTYRLWETLILGSIPIVESNAGFDRTYSRLPVLIVRHFQDVTPQLLDRAYACFLQHAHLYTYEVVLESYWVELVDAMVMTGQRTRLDDNHPPRHKYCSFL